MPLLLVKFGAEAAQVLGILTGGVAFTGLSFAYAFIVVESEKQKSPLECKDGEVEGQITSCHAASATARCTRSEAVVSLR